MKFKKAFIYVIIFINLFFILFSQTTAITKEEGIMKAFNSTEAAVEEVNMNAYVNIENVFKSPSEGRKICLGLAKELAIQDQKIKDTSEKGNTQVCLSGKKAGETVSIIVQSAKYEELKETNIVIDMVGEHLVDVNEWAQNIKAVLKNYGKATITSCITGSYMGELNSAKKEKIAQMVMNSLGAKEIEALRQENRISIVGFSSKIKDYISYGGNKVNVNIALRYNSYEGKTYLWVATPLIAIGY